MDGTAQTLRAGSLKARHATELQELVNRQIRGWAKPEEYVAFVDGIVEAAVATVRTAN
jgi:hypothetical protein